MTEDPEFSKVNHRETGGKTILTTNLMRHLNHPNPAQREHFKDTNKEKTANAIQRSGPSTSQQPQYEPQYERSMDQAIMREITRDK